MQSTKRMLTTALMAGALATGIILAPMSDGTAEAAPKRPVDDGVRCVWNEDGHLEFSMPGEMKLNPNTRKWQICGTDGQWHPAGNTIFRTASGWSGPADSGGETLTPVP